MADTMTSQQSGGYDDHTSPHGSSTIGQVALALVWAVAILYSLVAIFFGKHLQTLNHRFTEYKDADKPEADPEKAAVQAVVIRDGPQEAKDGDVNQNEPVVKTVVKPPTNAPPVPSFNEVMRRVVLFGFIMLLFYLSDYKKVAPATPRVYNEDQFYFLVFLLFLVGSCFTLQPTKDKILNRDQTEEWKGWMQVMFVWYHYFAAKPWYNWIRVYIAGYVWMTGFGNFSFFWIRKDFSLWRVVKMLFRLNFLVIFVCISVDNWYMLYYICPMHTYWFLSTYAFMGVLPSWNTDRYKMAAKFFAYAICNAVLFEIPNVHETIFRPFSFFLGFPDGKHDTMHEWAFRSGLDHWACFIGMLCAYNYPYFEEFILYLESASKTAWERVIKISSKVFLVVCTMALFLYWSHEILAKPKYEYNQMHPYTSWIPIIVFIVLRNIHPVLRTRYIHMFAWLGKITLETYLAQLHIYLQSNAKELIGYIPNHPLLTFSAATIIYLLLSHQLFVITNHLSAWLFPKSYRDILVRAGVTLGVFVFAGVLAYVMKVSSIY